MLRNTAKIIHAVTNKMIILSAVAMFFIAAISFCDVICRYFFNNPITGAQELVEVGMSVFVYMGVAYGIKNKTVIIVPVIVDTLKPRTKIFLKASPICYAQAFLLSQLHRYGKAH